ncbi:Anthocyanin 5-aromatic acyltransferase [Vitis vinifera]|uniref:Anthocyanin 5-aromatic acyltransferase n=1 Tax=Vitis vinifera TaxID=29760 RepID=A0A438IER5_VITVI|nr:Anthocyanin 5-aromatic acyltransferase [Vitis vinifera]
MPNVVTCLKFYSNMCLHLDLHCQSSGLEWWEVSENELEHFGFVADCRACLDPPLPENYFANLIGEAIQEKLGSKKGVLEGLDKWVVNFSSINIERTVGVAGSPRFCSL